MQEILGTSTWTLSLSENIGSPRYGLAMSHVLAAMIDWASPSGMGAEVVLITICCTCMQGLAMQRILAAMAERTGPSGVDFDFVLVAGHFLARDENIFTFFEGQGLRTYEASKNAAPLSMSKQVS